MARVSRVEFSSILWVLRCSIIALVPPVVAYRRVQYRQRHSGLPVFLLKYWVWGSGSGIWFHTQVVRGRFTGKIEHGGLADEKARAGALERKGVTKNLGKALHN